MNKTQIRTWYRTVIEDVNYLLERALSWLVVVVEYDDPGILRDHQKSERQETNIEPESRLVKIESGRLKGL